MATYTSMARTNYFRVKDVDAFNKWIKQLVGLDKIVHETEGTIGILFEDGVPIHRWEIKKDADGNDEDVGIDIDFMEELSLHLADEEVAVLQEIGNENIRFVSGHATAVNNKGQRREVNLNHIYDLAKELGSKITRAEY